MNILLSNDDGYQALGIKVLEDVLAEKGHSIYVSAPDSEQSGKSHAMTIRGSVEVTEYAPRHFHVTGTPADCIIYSHRCSLFPVAFDAVISGINHGYNLSTDIVYSGTCAAARQAAFYGMKAIALSAEHGRSLELLRRSAEFGSNRLEAFLAAIPSGAFMNINVPESFDGTAEAGGMGGIIYSDRVAVISEDGPRKTLAIEDAALEYEPSMTAYRADHEICRSGRASVSIIETLPSLSAAMEALPL